MNLYVSVKQLGKKKYTLSKESILVKDGISTLSELIVDIVTDRVQTFNENVHNAIIKVFTAEEIDDNIEAGGIKFGDKENTTVQSVDKAIQNALLSFEDGIYKVIVDGEEAKSLTDKIALKEGSELVFIKLTFLRGSFY